MKEWFNEYKSHIYLTITQKSFLSLFADVESFTQYSWSILGKDSFMNTSKISIVDVCIKLGIE